MTTEDPLKNWQLQQGDETADQWKLQDAEQNLNKNMQLQEGGPPEPQWQPVEYQREVRPRRRGGWILPSIVILALLGVLGYVGWVALGQGGANPLDPGAVAGLAPGATEQTPSATDEAAAVPPTPAPATATPEPTATPSPEATATATTLPTPEITTVELISGTVNSPDGVNARSTPDTAGEVLLLLPQNAGVTVVGEENDWVQVILPDNRVAWVSAQFVDRTSQQVTPEALTKIYADAGLPPPALPPSAGATPEAAPVSTEVTLAAIVTGDPSVNARGAPQVDGIVVTSLAKDSAVSAIGRSADNLWIALRLADGKPAWVLREFVSSEGSFDTLPVVDPAALVATVPLTTTTGITAPVTAGTATPVAAGPATLQPNGVVPLAPFTNSLPVGPALAISDTVGVNVRSAPNTDGAILVVAPNGAVLPIVGRTADGAWYQVRLPDERIGWMAAAAIVASSDAGNAPVIGEGAPAPEATGTETPVGPAVKATVSNELGSAVRSAPDQNLDPVVTLPVGTSLNAIGRTANNEWVQVALDDGTTAWARAATITLESDINTLPVTE